jgi:hypothetical protein
MRALSSEYSNKKLRDNALLTKERNKIFIADYCPKKYAVLIMDTKKNLE